MLQCIVSHRKPNNNDLCVSYHRLYCSELRSLDKLGRECKTIPNGCDQRNRIEMNGHGMVESECLVCPLNLSLIIGFIALSLLTGICELVSPKPIATVALITTNGHGNSHHERPF